LLIARGADVGATYEAGLTPLHVAALNGNARIVEALLAAGALINSTDSKGQTPLALALEKVHTNIAELLRQYEGQP
jgi:uncharacterized protein